MAEITAFGEPEPHSKRPLISYLGQYLLDHGQPDTVQEYGLQAFDFNVLGLSCTFAEKILALVRASYEEDPLAATGRKVRHLYDMHQMANQPEVAALLAGSGLAQQLAALQRDDARAGAISTTLEWKIKPLTACWAYAEEAANLRQL